MRQSIPRSFAVLALLAMSGCAWYSPAPLEPDMQWEALEGIRLADLASTSTETTSLAGASPAFDYDDGLSSEEAAGLAVVMNPSLRAFRHRRGIAEGQLVTAGLLPNPEIESIWLFPTGPVSWAGEVNALFDLTQALVLRRPRREQARIRLREVHWEIADQEWQLVNDVRLAFLDILYWDSALEANEKQLDVLERTVSSIQARYSFGVATELESLVAEADLAELQRQAKRLQGDRRKALQDLNQLIGLPPTHKTRIQSSEDPLAYNAISVEADSLAERIRSNRPDILAAEQAYLQAEKALQLAHRGRIPNMQVGPSYEGSSGGSEGDENTLGFGLSFDLPIFNRNQGEIAANLAEREQRRDRYVEQLHAARSEFYGAWADWTALDNELSFYFSDIAPRLDRTLELTEKAFLAGELDLLQVLIVQTRVLQSMRDILEQLRDFHRARVEVQRAIGPKQMRKPEDSQPSPR